MNIERRHRILLVDDHALVRKGLRTLLQQHADIEVIGDAANGQEALEKVEMLDPDLVVMDLSMPVMDGIAATKVMTAQYPRVAVIGLSSQSADEAAASMKSAGARDYILKDKAGDDLYDAIVSTLATPRSAASAS
ncbi:MAG: response regulator transcription factor [Nitrospiraceae bacterium]